LIKNLHQKFYFKSFKTFAISGVRFRLRLSETFPFVLETENFDFSFDRPQFSFLLLQHFGSHGGEECWQHPSEFELSFC
jgi:hypothetical protein